LNGLALTPCPGGNHRSAYRTAAGGADSCEETGSRRRAVEGEAAGKRLGRAISKTMPMSARLCSPTPDWPRAAKTANWRAGWSPSPGRNSTRRALDPRPEAAARPPLLPDHRAGRPSQAPSGVLVKSSWSWVQELRSQALQAQRRLRRTRFRGVLVCDAGECDECGE